MRIESRAGCKVLRFPAGIAKRLIADIPQLNYSLRRYRTSCEQAVLPWVIVGGDVN